MVEQKMMEPDIVGLVIAEALHVAIGKNNPLQVSKLVNLQRTYYELGLEPTQAHEIARPLGETLGLSTDATSGTPKLDYATILRMSFYSPKGMIPLTPTQHKILTILYVNQGLVVSRTEIEEKVFAGTPNNNLRGSLDVHFTRIRNTLKNLEDGFSPIRTVRGRGYFFSDPEEIIEVRDTANQRLV